MNLESEYHALFLPQPGGREDYEPEAFARIRIYRAEPSGVTQCPRDFLPEELPDAQALADQFGGGTYELWALHRNGQLYARRTIKLPGAPKPLGAAAVTDGGQPPIAAPQAGPMAPSGGLDPLIAYILQSQKESSAQMLQMQLAQQQQQTAMLTAMIGAIAQLGGARESPADLLRGFAELTKATAPAAPASGLSGVAAIRDVLETSRLIREETERAQPQPPEPDLGDTLTKVVQAVGPVLLSLGEASAHKPAPATPPILSVLGSSE